MKKPQSQLYYSLKTMDKREATHLADIETRCLEALWTHHTQGSAIVASSDVSLAQLRAAGLSPGDGIRFGSLDPISEFVADMTPATVDRLWPSRTNSRLIF